MKNATGLAITTALALCVGAVGARARGRPNVAEIFKQVESEATTNDGTARLLQLGTKDKDVRTYLAQRLPSIIGSRPIKRQVWLNCVRLAGEFRISEAVLQLVKFISSVQENARGTLNSTNHLQGFPCATALVQIGGPALPQLADLLEKGRSGQKWVAYRCLYLIGSAEAIGIIRKQVDEETDPGLKEEMQRTLDSMPKD